MLSSTKSKRSTSKVAGSLMEQMPHSKFMQSTCCRKIVGRTSRSARRRFHELETHPAVNHYAIDSEQPVGYHQALVDARGFAGGVYVYQVQASNSGGKTRGAPRKIYW
jgi:hypothetical protein